MEKPQPFLLRCTHGRLALELRLLPAGQDWQLLLTGGDAHIGAVILAEPADATPPGAPEAAPAQAAGQTAATPATAGTKDGVRLHVLRRTGHHDDKAALPLARLGVNPARVSLAVSLTLRFIPVVAQTVQDVREAQRARGIEKNMLALAVPVIVRTLKMADDVADAIDARSWD